MDSKRTTNEAADATSSGGASVGRNVAVLEQAEATGKYIVEHRGPREECRKEYVRLRDETISLESRRGIAAFFLAKARLKKIAENRQLMKLMEEVKSVEVIDNVVTTVGKNKLLDEGLAGSNYTATWYVGLIDNGSWSAVNAADTMSSHAGWTENTGYSQSTRVAASWAAASSGSKALASAASFSITADDTIKGCFLTSNNTKGGTTGILYSAGLFTAGDKVVQNGDTLNVSYTASL